MDSSWFMEQVQQEWNHNTLGLTVNNKKTFVWKVDDWARLSTHLYMMPICWSIGYFPSFSSALLPFLLLKTRLIGLATVPFPVPQPSFPSEPKADLPPQSMCIHDLQGHCTITVLVCFRPMIYGQLTIFHYCQMFKEGFSLFNKWLLFCRRLKSVVTKSGSKWLVFCEI